MIDVRTNPIVIRMNEPSIKPVVSLFNSQRMIGGTADV